MLSSKLRGAALFLAGSIFTTGLLVTCTGGTSSRSDGGPIAGDGHIQAGGDAKAAPGGTVWEYAMMADVVREVGPSELRLPGGAVQMVDCGTDPSMALMGFPPKPAIEREVCFLNKVGADGWELVQAQPLTTSHDSFIFRRPR